MDKASRTYSMRRIKSANYKDCFKKAYFWIRLGQGFLSWIRIQTGNTMSIETLNREKRSAFSRKKIFLERLQNGWLQNWSLTLKPWKKRYVKDRYQLSENCKYYSIMDEEKN